MNRPAVLIALIVAVTCSPAASGGSFEVRATDPLSELAEDLRARSRDEFRRLENLTGATLEEPVELVLYDRDSEESARVPSWIAGYTVRDQRTAVLFPHRANTYPNDGFEELLRHELMHVLIDRAARGADVPRWFHEGLATAGSANWSTRDRALMTMNMLTADEMSLDAIEAAFHSSDPSRIRGAYAASFAFIRFVMAESGPEAPSRILRELARGSSFEQSYSSATGSTLRQAETRFLRQRNFWNRWVPLLTSSIFLWFIITLLALLAFRRKRRRNQRVLDEWEEIERVLYPQRPPEGPGNDVVH